MSGNSWIMIGIIAAAIAAFAIPYGFNLKSKAQSNASMQIAGDYVAGSKVSAGGDHVNVAGRDIVVNTGPTGAQTLDTNRIITLKQKSKIVDVLLTNRGSVSIFYVRGDRKAEQYAEGIRNIFNTAYWHTSIEGASFAGFDRGLIVSAQKMSDRINVIIKAFDAGDINIKPEIDPQMKEEELALKVGSP